MQKWVSWNGITKAALFLGGMGGIVHETFFTQLDRPSLLVLFATMVGLPKLIGLDQLRRSGKS